ncbi:hypothetical protein [Pseudomonas sp. S9]|uniref:hypothetical protein n=1 Tax=Pseudomonas sp. S9 TaxID=686578 RepID=UPI00111027FF|nr:hypothetical protein [Pseudomonas sp. S9]
MSRTILITLFISVLSGCGLLPRTGTSSLALQIADAMSIPAHDISRAEYEETFALTGSRGRNLDHSLSGAAQLIASGDPTMLLLSGLTPGSPAARIQIAAWVPESLASTPEKAVAVASKAYIEARADVYGKDEHGREKLLSTKVRHVLGQPFGEGGLVQTYAQLFDLITDHSPNLAQAPSFMKGEGNVYGPIFLDAWGAPANADDIVLITKFSEQLPAWFFIYNPGLPGVSARSILNRGQKQLFVEP